jgi:lytic murein transglycosylase
MITTRKLAVAFAFLAATLSMASGAQAASCSKTAAGFDDWKVEFAGEATAQGINKRTLDRVMASISYNKATIRADRGQHSFKLSLDAFMRKRGSNIIVSRGKQIKRANAALFDSIEQRFGVPAGPLIAIWGMETGFGSYMGHENTLSAVATLAFDCRRSAYFTDQFYAALKLTEQGTLSVNSRGAAHGEVGQTQFLPKNVLKYGIDGDGNGRIDLIGSKADALASTANLLRGHGWRPGAGYQPGQKNFAAIKGWNDASVYQQAIAIMGAQIDGAGE